MQNNLLQNAKHVSNFNYVIVLETLKSNMHLSYFQIKFNIADYVINVFYVCDADVSKDLTTITSRFATVEKLHYFLWDNLVTFQL